jgi:hypothetical protein
VNVTFYRRGPKLIRVAGVSTRIEVEIGVIMVDTPASLIDF